MIDYSKFNDWFEKKFSEPGFAPGVLREAIKEIAKEAYNKALVDCWDMQLADLAEMRDLFNIQGTQTGRIDCSKPNLSAPPKTASGLLPAPCAGCGRRSFYLSPIVGAQGRRYCCLDTCTCPHHRKYHGGRPPQIRAREGSVCDGCEQVYKFMQKRKNGSLKD